jgi:hypothetical protein
VANVVLVLADLVRETPTPTTAFVAELAGKVQGRGPTLGIAMSWLEHRIAEQGQRHQLFTDRGGVVEPCLRRGGDVARTSISWPGEWWHAGCDRAIGSGPSPR